MKSSLLGLGWQALVSNPRVKIRLLISPVLAALVIGNWICAMGTTNVLLNGNEIRGAVFLVYSALAAGFAGSIAVVPPGCRWTILRGRAFRRTPASSGSGRASPSRNYAKPLRKKPGVRAAFPVSGGILLWYCCAFISLPQYLFGIPPKLLSVWVVGPAFLYTIITSYEVEFPLLVLCGGSCALLDFLSRGFGADRSTEEVLGYLVWFFCAVRAVLLVSWGPLSGLF